MKKYFLIILTLWFAVALSSCSKPEEIRKPDTDKVDPDDKDNPDKNPDDQPENPREDEEDPDEAEESCSIAITVETYTPDQKFNVEIGGTSTGIATIDWGDGTVEDLQYMQAQSYDHTTFIIGAVFWATPMKRRVPTGSRYPKNADRFWFSAATAINTIMKTHTVRLKSSTARSWSNCIATRIN